MDEYEIFMKYPDQEIDIDEDKGVYLLDGKVIAKITTKVGQISVWKKKVTSKEWVLYLESASHNASIRYVKIWHKYMDPLIEDMAWMGQVYCKNGKGYCVLEYDHGDNSIGYGISRENPPRCGVRSEDFIKAYREADSYIIDCRKRMSIIRTIFMEAIKNYIFEEFGFKKGKFIESGSCSGDFNVEMESTKTIIMTINGRKYVFEAGNGKVEWISHGEDIIFHDFKYDSLSNLKLGLMRDV